MSLINENLSAFFHSFVGPFMSHNKRRQVLREKAKKFTNVYIKNFGDSFDDDKLKTLFEEYGNIVSAKVSVVESRIIFRFTMTECILA